MELTESTKFISLETEPKENVAFDIDQITMECFMNKNVYNKVITKTNPIRFRENKLFQEQKSKYKESIMDKTRDLLSEIYCENNEIRAPIQESFDLFVKQVIQELELKKYERQEMKRDVLFESDSDESPLENVCESFWSKDKVVKKKGT